LKVKFGRQLCQGQSRFNRQVGAPLLEIGELRFPPIR
jgi:hypothetical protein